MKVTSTPALILSFAALALSGNSPAWAEESPSAEAAAFLASPTSLAAAITTVEAGTGGKVSTIEFVMGEEGAPDLIMADVIMADGSAKEVSVNPADGTVMNISDDQSEDEDADDDGDD